MHLSAPKIQSSKYTAGAITVAAAIITDGAEAIMDGAIVTIGEVLLPSVVII
jgi:hypothetical protein